MKQGQHKTIITQRKQRDKPNDDKRERGAKFEKGEMNAYIM